MGHPLARWLFVGARAQRRVGYGKFPWALQLGVVERHSHGPLRCGALLCELYPRDVLDLLFRRENVKDGVSIWNGYGHAVASRRTTVEAARQAPGLAGAISTCRPGHCAVIGNARSDALSWASRGSRYAYAFCCGQRLVAGAIGLRRSRCCSSVLGRGA